MKAAYRVPYVLLSLLLVTLAACAALPPATRAPAGIPTDAPTDEPTIAPPAATAEPAATGAAADVTAACPPATADMQRLVNFAHGYCLTYPAEYKVEKPNESETLLLIGGLLNAGDARVHISIEPANGRTAALAADQLVAENAGFEIERSEVMIASQPAIVLDKLPGQEINRRVFVVHDDRLYTFYFSPADPAVEAFADMETLYRDILSSFTFLPQGTQPPADAAALDCLTPTTGTQALVAETRGFCLLYPADYQMAEPNAGEVVLHAGSLQDVSRPRVFIQVADAQGRTVQQIADAAVAEVESSVPGHKVDRPFGVTFGYEVAERLDNMPGQDLSRQVIAVHGDKVYTLVFVPTDETQGDVYRQMEELYDLALRSFRFLR